MIQQNNKEGNAIEAGGTKRGELDRELKMKLPIASKEGSRREDGWNGIQKRVFD